jgi:tRNA 2-thiouridine synthesizing protein C
MKRVLVLFRSAPHGTSRAREGLDAALAALAFDQPLRVLFAGDGLYAIARAQDGTAAGAKPTAPGFRALPHHGAERVGALRADAEARGLGAADLALDVEWLDAAQARRWLAESDVVLGF